MKKFMLCTLSAVSMFSSQLVVAKELDKEPTRNEALGIDAMPAMKDQGLSYSATQNETDEKLKSVAVLGDELFRKTIKFLELIESDKKNITVEMIDDLERLLADIIRFTESLPEKNQNDLLKHVYELKPILVMARKALLAQ